MSYAPSTLRALACSLALACLALPTSAGAHARPAALNALLVDPDDPDHLVAQATWGMAISRDGGATWRWSCAAVLGVDPRIEDPDVQIAYEGRVLASTFDGLFVSDPEQCEWSFVSAELSDRWVIDLASDPSDPARRLAIVTDVTNTDQLYESRDDGRTWAPLGPPQDEVLLAALAVAPSRPERVYVSADIPGLPDARRTLILRSDDGGASFERLPFALTPPDERSLRLRAVDPTDPDVLYAVVLAAVDAINDPRRLVRSEDGGETWETALEASMLGDVLVSDDGARVWVGSRAGGVYRSDDAGRTFARVHPDLPVSCLTRVDGELRACTEEARAGFALARSADDGETWEPLLRLAEIDELIDCPTCSDVGVACPPWLPDVAYDLGFDAGPLDVELEPDGGIGLPRDAALPFECGGPPPPAPDGCACRATPAGGVRGLWLVLLLLAPRLRHRFMASIGSGGR